MTSCSQEKKTAELVEETSYTGMLKIEDTVSIQLEEFDFYRSRQTHVVKNGDKVYLYRENGMNNSIDVFDWTGRTKKETFQFDEIERFGSSPFLPLVGDSIFIASLAGKIYFARKDSIISISEAFVETKLIRYVGENPYKPIKIGNKVFMNLVSDHSPRDPEFGNRPLLGALNLQTDELQTLNIRYPDYFKENCWSLHQLEVPFTKNSEEQLVFSYQTDPTIYVYEQNKDTLVNEYKEVKSKYADTIIPFKECDYSDVTTYFRYLKSVPRYRTITYDKFKNVYYRIVNLPSGDLPDGQRNQDIVMPFSIMVLDKDFTVITERKLPAKTYDPIDYFITEKGLWISNNNEGAEDFNENTLSYTLFNLKKTE